MAERIFAYNPKCRVNSYSSVDAISVSPLKGSNFSIENILKDEENGTKKDKTLPKRPTARYLSHQIVAKTTECLEIRKHFHPTVQTKDGTATHRHLATTFPGRHQNVEQKLHDSRKTSCQCCIEESSGQLPYFMLTPAGYSIPSPFPTNNSYPIRHCRRRKARTVFSDEQMIGLEDKFKDQKYISTQERKDIAELLHLSEQQVKTWFQNRRMKEKKMKCKNFISAPEEEEGSTLSLVP